MNGFQLLSFAGFPPYRSQPAAPVPFSLRVPFWSWSWCSFFSLLLCLLYAFSSAVPLPLAQTIYTIYLCLTLRLHGPGLGTGVHSFPLASTDCSTCCDFRGVITFSGLALGVIIPFACARFPSAAFVALASVQFLCWLLFAAADCSLPLVHSGKLSFRSSVHRTYPSGHIFSSISALGFVLCSPADFVLANGKVGKSIYGRALPASGKGWR